MLGTRTKQINAYGKRSRRIIDVTSDSTRTASSTEIISIFDDMPPAPTWSSVASKMKKRENAVPAKTKATSPMVVGLQKKRRLSPVLSPIKKKQAARLTRAKAKAKPLPGSRSSGDPIVVSASPSRAPLSAVPFNIPGLPALAHKPGPATSKTPLKLKKPFSPFVDVDIIVLDDDGHTLHKERRASNTGLYQSNVGRSSRDRAEPIPPADSGNGVESAPQPRRPKRQGTRKTVIISDDSDSDVDFAPLSPQPVKASDPKNPPSQPSRTKSRVEVVIPPAPYKLPHVTPEEPSDASDDLPEVHMPTPNHLQYRSQALHHFIPSPPLKPRQLTPIKGRRKCLFAPPSPPSPTTPTDFDLSIDFSELSLGFSPQVPDFDVPDYLRPLLEECHQDTCGPHNFSTFIESFPCDPILQDAREKGIVDMNFRKIGEASYSEVFGIGDVVLKVIPLRDQSLTSADHKEQDGPAPSDAKDVRKEIIVTRAMGEVYGGFVKLLKAYVVRGRYPEVLLQLWDEYNERKGSESVRPDTFKLSQVYAIIVLPNGGPDLEAYTFHNASRSGWRQACSLFWQVAKALAHAEHLVSLEVFFLHRDLHWGQILVKTVPTQGSALKSLNTNQKTKSKSHRVFMDDLSHGVQATIIDLGLSRMDAGDGSDGARVHWTPFDEEVFMGEGDYQFDVYRMMRGLTGGDWESFHPVTNVLWLHYLLQKLLYSKGLKPPTAPRKTKATLEAAAIPPVEVAFSEKDCYVCLVDVEKWLSKSISDVIPGVAKPKGRGRPKMQAPVKPMASSGAARAGEIVAYGVKKGWIQTMPLF
ncbi:hypothetical protein NLJ89_g7304 [Agrocybe chaxingu]|uniref:non-specific serine/threonine protein kinase n=1 Tax=Agrocybe chaxingu TaxID=84603 RepID=A0A9W8JXM6_9AGAR|nr:hypothetical protein NLJ89_g7304 [Agrocybe chaxingu]